MNGRLMAYNHSIKSERRHSRDTHALSPSPGIEDFGRHDPAQRAHGGGEGVVVNPGEGYEGPLGGPVVRIDVCGCGRKVSEQDCGDEETEAVDQVAGYEDPAATELVDKEEAAEFP